MSAVFKPRCRILLVDARSLNSDLAVCQETRSGLPAMMEFPQVLHVRLLFGGRWTPAVGPKYTGA